MEYPDFKSVTGYGKVDGYAGVNCRHHAAPFDPKTMINNMVQYDEMEAKKQYELEQKQRAKERGIRSAKREVTALKTAYSNAPDEQTKIMAKKKLDRATEKLTRRNQEYEIFCRKNKLKTTAERLRVGN